MLLPKDFELFLEWNDEFGYEPQLYAIHDSDKELKRRGAFPVTVEEALRLNSDGYGIFSTPNQFKGARKKENLVEIRAWYSDLDDGTKEEQYGRIKSFKYYPSLLVTTKRGYQSWYLAESAGLLHFDDIQKGLAKRLKGDLKATDVARLLRVPGFYHMKDPQNPFLVQIVDQNTSTFSEMAMGEFIVKEPYDWSRLYSRPSKFAVATSESEALQLIDCAEALMKLSGTEHVNNEIYELVPQKNGNLNIWANGKDSGCFIDHRGLIGSKNGGGPTILQWLMWFDGMNRTKAMTIIRDLYPDKFRGF